MFDLNFIDYFFQFHLTNKIWSKRWFCNSFMIECFGAIGPNCSIPCESNFFGYLCKNQCDCQKDEICNRYFGCSELHFKVARLYCWKYLFKENLFEKAKLAWPLIFFSIFILTASILIVYTLIMIYRWGFFLHKSMI